MKSLLLSFLLLNSLTAPAQNIMDCTLESGSGEDHLFVYLTDTTGVQGFNIKIGSAFDGNDLLSSEYLVGALPAEAALIENTFSLSLDQVATSPRYVWVTVLLAGGGSRKIKLTTQ